MKEELLKQYADKETKYITPKQKEKVIAFLTKYKDHYSEETIDFLLNEMDKDIYEQEIALLRQIFVASNFYEDDSKNPYLKYLRVFEEYFSYDQNIVDVGAGRFPADATLLKERQKSGTIAVYDPNILPIENKDLIIKKEKFTLQTDLTGQDLLFGIYPCEATEAMIRKANQEHKNLFLGLCGCSHYNDYEIFFLHKDPRNWQEDMYYLLRGTNQDNSEIKVVESEYPILIKKLK